MLKKTTPRLSLAHRLYLVLAFILIIATPSYAQEDCGCDHVITPAQGYIKASNMPTVQPGDVICIQAGVRSRLKLMGFQGTKEKPLIFKNCGGQVIFDKNVDSTTASGMLIFENSRYFRVTGTGSPDHKYGFLIRKSNGSALGASDSDFEIDHVEIADAGFAGIFAKIEAYCDNTEYHRDNFVMDNISIHDNYIHDTHGEGMYIGSSWYQGKQMECGILYPPLLHNLKVYNNLVENTGADGLQIGCAGKDAEVYNNTIRNYGFNPFSPVHTNGLMLGGGFQGKVYNNVIVDGAGMGLNCFGIGNVWMYNNLVVRAGTDGIFIDERGIMLPGAGFHTHNNTVISPKRDGIRIYSRNSVGNTFTNNLVVAPGSLVNNYYNRSQYLYIIDANVDYSENNNLFLATADLAQFVNPAADNYELKATSPAIDKGALLSYITFDFNTEARPQGAGIDIGAYEFGGETTSINNAPTASAGEDKTVNLPENSIILSATATDTDGSIASVRWTKVSGPAATLSGTTTLTLGLSSLLEGTYTFRFTATDNEGATSSDDVQLNVVAAPVANQAPVVQAGNDRTLTLPTNSTTLSATATDTDGIVAAVNWTKVSGPTATLTGTNTLTLALSDLVEGAYTFRLTVKDNTGASAQDDVNVTVNPAPTTPPVADNNGLNYAYYIAAKKNTWNQLPDFSTMTPVKTGIAPTISLDARTQNDYFGFVFTGFLEIKAAGNYTFYTLSDEGSQLYINDQLLAENTGSNKVQERSGTLYLTAGFHPISVNYFDRNNAQKLAVSYVGPGIRRIEIPSAVLHPTDPTTAMLGSVANNADETIKSSGSEIAAPSDLYVRYNSEKGTAYLSWNDNSTNEIGFEIYMATGSSDSEYKKAGSTTRNKQNYTIVHLRKDQPYHIKVRARTLLTFSDFTNVVDINDKDAAQASGIVQGQKVLINFNYGKNAAAPWNNFDQDPDPMDMMTNLVDDKGAPTSISVTLLSSWGWASTGSNGWNNLGMTTGDNSGVIPDDVMKTCFWTERNASEEIEIAGLQPNQFYRFSFYGSRDASGDRTTHYRIGKKTVTLDAAYNTSKKVSIYNAKADAKGKLKVYVQKGNKAIFGYLNAMIIEATGYVAPGMEETEAMRAATTSTNGKDMTNSAAEIESNHQTFSAYPNPATDHIILHYKNTTPNSKITLQVLDLTGNVRIATQETATDENGIIRIDLDSERIATGYYLIRIMSESGVKTIKFLKL